MNVDFDKSRSAGRFALGGALVLLAVATCLTHFPAFTITAEAGILHAVRGE